jgi:hypothetical protein
MAISWFGGVNVTGELMCDSTEACSARVCSITRVNAAQETSMDRSYVAENDAERARLQAIVARLTDADMARTMSEGWTVGVGLLHLSFWDRLSLSKFEEWERTGTAQIPPARDVVDGINQAMLPWWRSVAPAQVRHEVVAAAEAVDRKAESLPTPIVEAILAVRPRSLARAMHRRQHLDQIERALAG